MQTSAIALWRVLTAIPQALSCSPTTVLWGHFLHFPRKMIVHFHLWCYVTWRAQKILHSHYRCKGRGLNFPECSELRGVLPFQEANQPRLWHQRKCSLGNHSVTGTQLSQWESHGSISACILWSMVWDGHWLARLPGRRQEHLQVLKLLKGRTTFCFLLSLLPVICGAPQLGWGANKPWGLNRHQWPVVSGTASSNPALALSNNHVLSNAWSHWVSVSLF